MPRIMTYNVHRCIGVDGRLDVSRIAAVIAHYRPEIVALQELDVGRARTAGVDQAHAIAERLGMSFHFNAALTVQEERYGDAVLSAAPLTLIKAAALPGSSWIKGLEPRGALRVGLEIEGRHLEVISTHLGLAPHEQRAQVQALVGPGWIANVDPATPLIVAGDFNVTRRQAPYRLLTGALRDARRLAGDPRAGATFPSRFPMLDIDHIFVGSGVKVLGVQVCAAPLARVASDHLPLILDFSLG